MNERAPAPRPADELDLGDRRASRDCKMISMRGVAASFVSTTPALGAGTPPERAHQLHALFGRQEDERARDVELRVRRKADLRRDLRRGAWRRCAQAPSAMVAAAITASLSFEASEHPSGPESSAV